MAIIAARFDLNVDQMVAATTQDADAPQHMLSFLSQLPPNLRLPRDNELRVVTFRLLYARALYEAEGGVPRPSRDSVRSFFDRLKDWFKGYF